MMNTRTTVVAVVGMLWLGSPGVARGQGRALPVPPVPPAMLVLPVPSAPPVPPVAPVAPVAPVFLSMPFGVDADFDFEFNKEAFKLDMEQFKLDMDDFKESMKDFKFDIKPFPEALALQVPRPVPEPRPFEFKGPGPMPPGFSGPADSLYNAAHDLINSGRYDRAIDQLNRLIGQYDGKADAVANRVDAALYWKAYAQLKESILPEALSTLADLQKRFSDSRWLKDARVLELEVRQASGQRVSADVQGDEELKLLALRGVMQADPDRGLPMIEQLMNGNGSVRLKENALFVLSQSRATRAREIISNVARNHSNPDVQLKAVRYLGAMRTPESRQSLDEIYRSTSDSAVKRTIIQSYVSGEAVDRLSEIARNDKDVQLRKTAIRSLGSIRRSSTNNNVNTGELLRSIYQADSGGEVRKDVISALASQQNGAVMVELAKQEKNPDLKKEIVTRLSNMKGNKEATDYMLELLK